jgi:oligoribonuclease NrnB/cAMP/cGMP phosphodiesterase (DHH superfamily)
MRLLTRSDFDGLVCAVLLVEKGLVDEYQFVHPKDVQDGIVEATSNDVLANIPYIPGCGLWFDHHASEAERLDSDLNFKGACCAALSAAQVIWDYYGGVKEFGEHFLPLMDAVNKSDAGLLSRDEILNPQGWILLSFIMDPRTGLGRYQDYRISNYRLMEDMIQYCRTKTAEEILLIEDVKERVDRFLSHQEPNRKMLTEYSRADGNVIITDLRDRELIHVGNRFLIYALYPDQNIELRVMWGRQKQNVVITCGHSILNRSSNTNVGRLMLKYGGGGHPRVGTCQVPVEDAERALEELVAQIRTDG